MHSLKCEMVFRRNILDKFFFKVVCPTVNSDVMGLRKDSGIVILELTGSFN